MNKNDDIDAPPPTRGEGWTGGGPPAAAQAEPESVGEGFAMSLHRFWAQLRRRRVIRTMIVYVVGAWMLIEVASVILPELMFPEWSVRFVIIMAIIGLPPTLLLAWIFDIKRTELDEEALDSDATRDTGAGGPAVPSAAPPLRESALASVAVLPFDSLTSNSEHAYIADGIASELHGTLSKMHRLRIASRRSSFAFRGSDLDVREIARRLNVHYILSGSLLFSQDRIRVIAELDNAEAGIQLWSQQYDRDVGDVFSVSKEIAEAIVSSFGGERLRAEILDARNQPTTSLDAWGLVQRARSYLMDPSGETLAEAVSLLTRAAELDPDYAAAHATLGSVLAERVLNGFSEDPSEDKLAALAAVARARELAPNDPFVLKMSGVVLAYFGEYKQSAGVLRRAVNLAPFDFGAWGYLGWPLVLSGDDADLEELHGILDRLMKEAPRHPGKSFWLYHKSVAYSCQSEVSAAVEFAKKSVAAQPKFALGWMQYANALGHQGETEPAREAAANCASLSPTMTPQHYASLVNMMSAVPKVVDARLGGLRQAGLLSD